MKMLQKINVKQLINDRNRQKALANRLFRFCWVIFRTVLLAGIAFLILYPIFTKLSTSFKSRSDLYDPTSVLIPGSPTVNNYKEVLDFIQYDKALLNTFLFTGFCALLQTLSCTLVAYGLARFKFWGRRIIFAMSIFVLVIPAQTILLPLYLQFMSFSPLSFVQLHPSGGVTLLGTYWPLALLSISCLGVKNGLFIFLMRQYFINMPLVLEEAAEIDGCGTFKTFYRIMLPNAVPMIVTVLLFAFVWQWNDYFYNLFLGGEGLGLLSVKIYDIGRIINTQLGDPFNNITTAVYNNAAMMLHMIPVVILYIFTQRFFIQSIERSGIVG